QASDQPRRGRTWPLRRRPCVLGCGGSANTPARRLTNQRGGCVMKAHLERMLRSMAWADRQALAAVRGCPPAQAEALPLLAHLVAAEHVWLDRLQERETSVPVWPPLTVPECEKLAAENAAGYADFLGALGEADLAAPVRYRNTKGQEFATPVLDILTHVVIH